MTRRRGTGSIRKRDGKFYFRISINGRRKEFLLKAKNHKEADLECRKYYIIADSKTPEEIAYFVAKSRGIFNDSPDIKLTDAFLLFQNSAERRDCTQKTLDQHERFFYLFLDWLSNNYPVVKKVHEIDRVMANRFFAYVGEKYKSKTYNYVVNTMKYVFRIVLDTQKHPFAKIRKKYYEPNRRMHFTLEQFEAIIEVISSDDVYLMHPEEMKLIFLLGAYTGMRFKDCVFLKEEYINWDKRLIQCIPHKTRKKLLEHTITIPIHPKLYRELKMAKDRREGEYFCSEAVRRYHYNEGGLHKDARVIINYALSDRTVINKKKLLKIKSRYSFGSLRHTFVSFCANADVPIQDVSAIVGHTSVSMTRYYTHLSQQSLEKVLAAFPAVNLVGVSSDRK